MRKRALAINRFARGTALRRVEDYYETAKEPMAVDRLQRRYRVLDGGAVVEPCRSRDGGEFGPWLFRWVMETHYVEQFRTWRWTETVEAQLGPYSGPHASHKAGVVTHLETRFDTYLCEHKPHDSFPPYWIRFSNERSRLLQRRFLTALDDGRKPSSELSGIMRVQDTTSLEEFVVDTRHWGDMTFVPEHRMKAYCAEWCEDHGKGPDTGFF